MRKTVAPQSENGFPRGTLAIFVLAAVAAALALGHLALTQSEYTYTLFQPDEPYPVAPMQEVVRPERVAEVHATIVEMGSRFMGQPGFFRAADFVRAAFEEAGLEIYEQEFEAIVPQTAFREIYLEGPGGESVEPYRRRLEEVEVYPFMPNQMQPVVTPGEGMSGELVLLNEGTLATRSSFDGCIGLIDSKIGEVPRRYGFDWTLYANLGLKALIVSHSEGMEKASWIDFSPVRGTFHMVSSIPINFVRLGATREIFNYVGQNIHLRVRVDYKRVANTTFFGLLRAPRPATEAILLTAPYDTPAILPDRAPGILSAINSALQLQLLEGLLPYRDTLTRDIIFTAFGSSMMAEEGHNRVLGLIRRNDSPRPKRPLKLDAWEALGERGPDTQLDHGDPRQVELAERWEQNERQLRRVTEAQGLFEAAAFAVVPEVTAAALDGLKGTLRKFVEEQFKVVVTAIGFELSDPLMAAKVATERAGGAQGMDGPVFRRYLAAKGRYEEIQSAIGYRMVPLLRENPELAGRYDLRKRLHERMDALRGLHEQRRREFRQNEALLNLLSSYERLGVFSTRLAPAPPGAESKAETVSVGSGSRYVRSTTNTAMRMLDRAGRRLGIGDSLQFPAADDWVWENNERNIQWGINTQAATMWGEAGYPTFFVYNLERRESCATYPAPLDLPFMHDLGSLRHTFAVIGETFLSLAHGNGSLERVQIQSNRNGRTYGGRVVAGAIGRSLIPDFPVKDALIAHRSRPDSNMWAYAGHFRHPIYMTDLYGRYEAPHNFNDFPILWNVSRAGGVVAPLAAWLGDDGIIAWITDEGEATQRLSNSTKVPWDKAQDVTIVVFRAAPVTLLDITNPQTLKEYTGVKMIQRDGLIPFERVCRFGGWRLVSTFLEPDRRCYVELQSGTLENDLVKVTRAYLTNVDDTRSEELKKEIDGIGYLVADHSFILNIPTEVATSMAYVEGRRLALQNAYHMADERTNDYHGKVLRNIEEAKAPGMVKEAATQAAREAVTYATLNHPILRESIFEAVIGILWYLALLVPFVFFFEKLLFCFSAVRKQLAAQAVIFAFTFALLRLLHPAFAMVRSSLMILLGFVIVLISAGLIILFSGKFSENLEELRRRQGKISGAEVDKLGVLASAFMLGLNNMHRRKVRTGLTCATITLLTFVIICFSSVENDLVEEATAVGKAPYQGMLIKKAVMAGFHRSEIKAVEAKFGGRFAISPRQMGTGNENWSERRRTNPEYSLLHKGAHGMRKLEVNSVIRLRHNEPLQNRIRFLTRNAWFTEEDEIASQLLIPIFIPDQMAERLDISVEEVNKGGVKVWLEGTEVLVRGIFDGQAYNTLIDLDGHPVLPYDITAIEEVVTMGWGVGTVAYWDDPRISAEQVVLAPYGDHPEIPGGRTLSVAVSMPGTDYKDAWQVIAKHMEQTSKPLYYGLDGVAFRGQKRRAQNLAGYIDLLIPLLIAALTVLNTMRGSVYERRDEIYVYNSVGIAPRYVFFMFFAEAFVYAVVGAVLGYILSQGTGRVLIALDLTGGLNMTFTSLTAIYASLAIFAAVMASTYFPARSAMEIAAPAEEAGWELPEPQDDDLKFELPFTFRNRGRLGILAFFDRWLCEHGEGGGGRFFSGLPEFSVRAEADADGDATYVPAIRATIWMKPLDLAVSQHLTIAMPDHPETGEYKARLAIQRLSGTREAWLRLNKPFVAQLRRQFLHWHAADPGEQNELFAEARERLTTWASTQR